MGTVEHKLIERGTAYNLVALHRFTAVSTPDANGVRVGLVPHAFKATCNVKPKSRPLFQRGADVAIVVI